MPAKSKSQQQAAGIALAAKRGEIQVSDLKGAAKGMYDSMSEKELKKIAGTEHEDLPKHVEEKLREYVRKTISEVLNENAGGYVELFLMNDNFTNGVELIKKAYTEWKQGPETKHEDIPFAKSEIINYIKSELKKL